MKRLLRTKQRKKKPSFRRQEYAKQKKLKPVWRRPRGKHSKLRMHETARGRLPSPGFSSPRKIRGLNAQGLEEVRVFTQSQLTPALKGSAIVIAGSVGKRRRNDILKKAEELELKVSNA